MIREDIFDPPLCEACHHYSYVHPCKGWDRETRTLIKLGRFQVQLLKRCQCKEPK